MTCHRFRPAGAGERAARAAGQLVGPLHPRGGEGRHLSEDPGQRSAGPPPAGHRHHGVTGLQLRATEGSGGLTFDRSLPLVLCPVCITVIAVPV